MDITCFALLLFFQKRNFSDLRELHSFKVLSFFYYRSFIFSIPQHSSISAHASTLLHARHFKKKHTPPPSKYVTIYITLYDRTKKCLLLQRICICTIPANGKTDHFLLLILIPFVQTFSSFFEGFLEHIHNGLLSKHSSLGR